MVNSELDNLTADDGLVTLREAIIAANTDAMTDLGETGSGADEIIFNTSLDGTPILLTMTGAAENASLSGDLDISSAIVITGNGVGNTIIDAGARLDVDGNITDAGLGERVLHVLNSGNLTLDAVTVTGGNAVGDLGGGVYSEDGTATITSSTISANTAGLRGGGVYNIGTATITSSTISANTARFQGGGVYNSGTATITSSTISANTAGLEGGGVFSFGTATITSSTISANTAEQGGGVFSSGTATITSSTISANTAEFGGGVHNLIGTATINNTIIAGSLSGNDLEDFGGIVSGTNNLVQDGSGIGLTGTVSGDPLLGPLADNGGPTFTHALLAGSDAINAGSNANATEDGTVGGTPLTTDQRGANRFNGTVDIGAFEVQPETEVSVAVAGNSVAEDEVGNLVYTFTRSTTIDDLTVNFTLSGDASGDTDYTVSGATMAGNSGIVTFADGDATATITIDPTPDTTVELDETVVLTVDAGTDYVLGTVSTATATITNDDTATVSIGDVSRAEGDGGPTMFTFTVSLDNPAAENVTFDFTTVGDTAVAGSDFTAISGSGMITAGETQTTIEIEVSGDTMVESDEQFFVDVSNLRASGLTVEFAPTSITQLGVFDTPGDARSVQVVGDVAYVADRSGGLRVLNVDVTLSVRATATITNDDTATADLSVTANGDENGPVDVVLTVTLSQVNNTGSAITFDLDDLLTGSAVSGTDYTAIADDAVISIADGESTGTLTVLVSEDSLLEATETIDAQISNSSNAAVTIGTATTSANITDDDAATLSIADVTIAEGGGLLFTVLLDNAVQGAFDVNVSFTDGSATGGTDYDNAAVTLNFAGTAGETQQFTVTTTDDTLVEADGTFTVNLSATNALVTASDTAIGTITSDDVPSISVDDVTVAEGTDVVFTVSLDQAPLADVTVDVMTADGTAVAPGDYTAFSTQTLTFSPGGALSQTVTVMTTDDSEFESDETFVLDLSNVSGGVIGDAQGMATLTSDDIDRDPDPTLAISPDGTTTSDDPITFTFQFSETVSGFDSSDITVQNGTARTFTAIDGDTFTLTVVPTASGVVTVSVAADAVVDAGNQGNAATSATVTSNINPAGAVPTLDAVPRFPTEAQPTVTWQPVAGVGSYEVWLSRLFPAGARILQENSIVTTTEFTPLSDLDPGFYRYWVRAIDDTGAASPWSTSNSFEVRPSLQNTDVRTFERRPTFSWNAVANAPGYEIFIRTVTGDIRVTDITQTSFTPTVDLAVGPIRWWIRTSDAPRNRGWSDVGLMDVRTNIVSASSTSIVWNTVSGAGRYILHVQNVDTGVVAVRENQLSATSYSPTTPLAAGNYRVWVKAINAQNDLFSSGLWSQSFDFSVSAVSNDTSDDGVLSSLQLAATDIITTAVEANNHLSPVQQTAHSVATTVPGQVVSNAVESVAGTTPETTSAVETELAFLDVIMGETIALGALIES